jgi:predicted kinase
LSLFRGLGTCLLAAGRQAFSARFRVRKVNATGSNERVNMEAVILIGIQGSGKSSFCKGRFFDTHVRINLDMLRRRPREAILVEACLKARQPFVVDNTNPTRADRQRYIPAAKAAGFRIVGYYFESDVDACDRRNRQRPAAKVVPRSAVVAAHGRLEPPALDEGFDELHHVTIGPDGAFVVQDFPGS